MTLLLVPTGTYDFRAEGMGTRVPTEQFEISGSRAVLEARRGSVRTVGMASTFTGLVTAAAGGL